MNGAADTCSNPSGSFCGSDEERSNKSLEKAERLNINEMGPSSHLYPRQELAGEWAQVG